MSEKKNWLLQGITDVSENLNNIKLFFSIDRKKISVGFGTSFTYSFMDGNFNLRFTFFFDFLMAQLDNGKIRYIVW